MSGKSTYYKTSSYDEEEESEEEEDDEDEEESSEHPPPVPSLVHSRFRVKQEIGKGSYSEVYLGWDEKKNDEVAIKVEWQKAEKGDKLLQEAVFYLQLGRNNDAPRVRWSGTEGEYNIMVMGLMGPSLDDSFKRYGKFSLKTVLMLGEQIIDRLEFVHGRGILYRDIKPHNFLMGLKDANKRVFICDFGLAKRYIDQITGEHILGAKKKRKGVTGTVRYSSLNVHEGYDAGRRDDLEATGYMLIHFLRGDLPWLGLKATSKQTKHEVIGEKKKETPDDELCRGFPDELVEYFRYCRSLKYADKPDYEYLRRLFRELFDAKGYQRDFQFEWSSAGDEARPLSKRKPRSKSAPPREVAAKREAPSRSREGNRDPSPQRQRDRSRSRRRERKR